MQYRCAASAPQLFVEFGGIPHLSGTPKEKSRRASSLANKEAMPCHFLYACRNPSRSLKCSFKKSNTADVRCGRAPSCMNHRRHSNGPPKVQSTMNRHKFFQNPKIADSIYRLLSKKWPYYSFGGNRSPYHYFW